MVSPELLFPEHLIATNEYGFMAWCSCGVTYQTTDMVAHARAVLPSTDSTS